jgi:hypothetical protein
MFERVVMALTLSLLVVTVAHSEPAAIAFAGVLGLAVTAVLSVGYAAVLLRCGELRIGRRARQHREVLSVAPAPRHPNTAGRTRSRAPARPLAAA